MAVAIRVIPCLDVHDGRVVKGVNFVNLRDAGDPVELATAYGVAGADELTFLDISASVEGRATTREVVGRTAETVFIPLTVGGGVRSPKDVDDLLRTGADKVAINTAAIDNPQVISDITTRFGNQVLVLSVDARREPGHKSGYGVTTHGGRTSAGLDAIEWAKQAVDLGAGGDPAELDGRRRHHRRVRPGDAGGHAGRGERPADRLRGAPAPRPISSTPPGPVRTPSWLPACSTSGPSASPRSNRPWPRQTSPVRR